MLVWIGSVVAAAILCFMIGATWYGVIFGTAVSSMHPAYAAQSAQSMAVSVVGLELARCLIVSATFAYFIHRMGITTMTAGLALAVVAWGGFQVVGLIGSILHEDYPPKLFAIHMGDALAKAVASCSVIIGLTGRFG
jgi:hypothetical protein